MSQRKRLCSDDTGNLSIKQFFTCKPKTAIIVEPPNQESASSSNTISLLHSSENNQEQNLNLEFEFCKDAGEVCSKIARDQIFREMFPELHWLCCIALSIPLATAWPERGFSALCRVKTKQRNRLLGATLNALMNVSINGPPQLTDEDAKAVAEKWQNTKERRQVTERALKLAEFEYLVDGDNDGSMESVLLDEFETEKFLL